MAVNKVRKLQKRKEMIADGRRYIIYYTFGDQQTQKPAKSYVKKDEKKDV